MNQKLLRARRKRFWTQEEASAKVNVAVGTYRRWEQGTQLPHTSTLALLCQTFELPTADLGFPDELFQPVTPVQDWTSPGQIIAFPASKGCQQMVPFGTATLLSGLLKLTYECGIGERWRARQSRRLSRRNCTCLRNYQPATSQRLCI
jgi:DNA-binding XRE family transcriptional regulator